MERTKRELIFFVLIFLVFYLAVKFSEYFMKKSGLKADVSLLVVGLIFTLAIVALYNLARLKSNEPFWQPSLGAMCSYDPFFWNGDSELSKECRAYASTPEGRVDTFGRRCPTGQVGVSPMPFYYSVLSDDSWKSQRCQDRPNCPLIDGGECLTPRQLP